MLVKQLRISIVVDNYIDLFLDDFKDLKRIKPGTLKKPLIAGHGLSILIDSISNSPYRLIMDASHSFFALLNNLEAMSIDLAAIDGIFLSHAHPDHFGGLKELIENISLLKKKKIDLFIGKDSFFPKLLKTPHGNIGPWPLAMDELKNVGAKINILDRPVEFANGLFNSGIVERTTDFEQIMKGAYRQVEDDTQLDTFTDENSIFIPTNKGVVVISACSHRGIINIINSAKKLTKMNLRAAIGGFHLGKASTDVINKTVSALRKENPEWIIAGHCTGIKAHCKLMNEIDGYHISSVGTSLTMSA